MFRGNDASLFTPEVGLKAMSKNYEHLYKKQGNRCVSIITNKVILNYKDFQKAVKAF